MIRNLVVSACKILALVGLWSLVACEDVVEEPTPSDEAFFPTQVGLRWTYSVDSVYYDKFNQTVDTFTFQRKDSIYGTILVQDSVVQYMVDVYRKTDSTEWIRVDEYRLYRSQNRGVKVKGNQPKVELVFPIRNRLSWDANQLTALAPDVYRYSDEHQHAFATVTDFPQMRLVLQALDTTIIDESIRWKAYAKDVGLVEQRIRAITKENGKYGGSDVHLKLIDFKGGE